MLSLKINISKENLITRSNKRSVNQIEALSAQRSLSDARGKLCVTNKCIFNAMIGSKSRLKLDFKKKG